VKLDALRQARDYCARTLDSEYPFAQMRFKTDGVHVLHALAEYEDDGLHGQHLVATDVGGQLVWVQAVADRIGEFDYEDGLALRWHPRGRDSVILIDPRVAFGAPIIGGTGVPTRILRDRFQAGEHIEDIQEDFGLTRPQLEQALFFEDVAIAA